jgi:hypothetical protein
MAATLALMSRSHLHEIDLRDISSFAANQLGQPAMKSRQGPIYLQRAKLHLAFSPGRLVMGACEGISIFRSNPDVV